MYQNSIGRAFILETLTAEIYHNYCILEKINDIANHTTSLRSSNLFVVLKIIPICCKNVEK